MQRNWINWRRFRGRFDRSQHEYEPDTDDILSSEPVDVSDIYSGLFVLVNVPSQQSRGQKVRLFKNCFHCDNNDITDVKFSNIVGKLQQPEVKPKGLFTILYEFPLAVDVCENKGLTVHSSFMTF